MIKRTAKIALAGLLWIALSGPADAFKPGYPQHCHWETQCHWVSDHCVDHHFHPPRIYPCNKHQVCVNKKVCDD